MKKFSTGAIRDESKFDFDFFSISPVALKRLAKVHHEGNSRYGRSNWKRGLPFTNILNHLINHLCLYLRGDKTEDHMAKISWAANTIMHYEEFLPELNDLEPMVIKEAKDALHKTRKKARSR